MSNPKHRENLQHEAEHTQAHHMSVAGYMLILFVVAFLLLLLAFFQQKRANDETIEGLQKSVSAMTSVQEVMAQRDQLLEENEKLEAQLELTESELKQTKADAEARLEALSRLNRIRALYNKGSRQEARELLDLWETEAPGALEETLGEIASSLPQDVRDDYDPLEAFQSLKSWLI